MTDPADKSEHDSRAKPEDAVKTAAKEAKIGVDFSGTRHSSAHRMLDIEQVYRENAPFVWRSAKRFGVPESAVADVVQDVFVVVHRKLEGFEGKSSIKTWIYAIVRRVVKDYFRSFHRKQGREVEGDDFIERKADTKATKQLERHSNIQLVREILASLDQEKREVFVLVELEEMTAPQVAEALSLPLKTVNSRLRLAPKQFEEAAHRFRVREGWGKP